MSSCMEFSDELFYVCIIRIVLNCCLSMYCPMYKHVNLLYLQIYEIVRDLGVCNNYQYSLLVGILQDHNDDSNMDLYFGDILGPFGTCV